MKNSAKKYLILPILFLTICFTTNSCKNDPTEQAKKELQVKPSEGFCTTHEFPNATWTFDKKNLPNGDIELDKSLIMKGTFPNPEDYYDLTLIVDYYESVPIKRLPLDFTTITPDGKSRQSRSVEVVFNTDSAKVIEEANAKKLKRFVQVIYPQKNYPEKGEFTFEIYSKYTKISLDGIKAISIKALKNNPE